MDSEEGKDEEHSTEPSSATQTVGAQRRQDNDDELDVHCPSSGVAPSLSKPPVRACVRRAQSQASSASTGCGDYDNDESWISDVLARARLQTDNSSHLPSDGGGIPEPPSSGLSIEEDENPMRKMEDGEASDYASQEVDKGGGTSTQPPRTYEEKGKLCHMASVYSWSNKEHAKELDNGHDIAIAVARSQSRGKQPTHVPPPPVKAAEASLQKVLHHAENENREGQEDETRTTTHSTESRSLVEPREATPGAFLSDWNGTVPTDPVRYSLLSAGSSTAGTQQQLVVGDEHSSEQDMEAPLPCSNVIPTHRESSTTRNDTEALEQTSSEPDNDNSQSGSSRSLVEADPISESRRSHFMPLAEEVGEGQERNALADVAEESKVLKRKFAGIVAVVLLGGLIALLIALLTGTSNKASSSQATTSHNETQAPSLQEVPIEEFVMSLLPEYTLAAMKSPTSVQSKAYQWLLNDPNVTTYTAWRIRQRLALSILYHTTNGDQWYDSTNWLSYDHHECEWYAATSISWKLAREEFQPIEINLERFWDLPVCSDEGVYVQLRLYANNLHGSLPREVGWLSSLRTMLLFVNDITGTLPSEVSSLKSLEILGCVACGLSGTIPTEIGMMSSLKALGLYVNPSLHGTLPSELGLLGNISTVRLEECALTGTLPTELGLLTSLKTLGLSDNHFVEGVPTELGLLTELVELSVHTNKLTGQLPSELGLMVSLGEMEIEENFLTGTIPLEVWSLTNLYNLQIHNNQLEGSLATEIGRLALLSILSLNDNKLEGRIPLELYSLTDMKQLHLNGNSFSGYIPPSLGKLTKLEEVSLSNTTLTGVIPSEIGLLSSLQQFTASNSSLSGTLPGELMSLLNLTILDLSHNAFFSGTIAEELCSIPIVFSCSETLCGCTCSCE